MKRNMTELLMQEGMDLTEKKDEKMAREILAIAKENNIPVNQFSKHDLNMLTDNRPHQGFVLRAKPRDFVRVDELPPADGFKCVLALDEVWDPQNFGALLRTAHFLECAQVVVCAKNSAPLSPTVSKASSGALELMDVYSTSNMMRFLDRSKANGWQVVGTSLAPTAIDLKQAVFDKPTILVLGNEGHGMRTNIVNRCDVLVKIAGLTDNSGVDSLNVSVTGGILLYEILSASRSV
jgi:21S rRNA (GM2251-2'-O)-methyltransferase